MKDERQESQAEPRPGPASTSAGTSATNVVDGCPSRWPESRLPMMLVGGIAAAAAAVVGLLASVARLPNAAAQPEKYMNGAQWKAFLAASREDGPSWFARWNTMVQPRIDQLVALAESERDGKGVGDVDADGGGEPFRLTLVGDSTMMQQHGVLCAFLGERPGRRFDPAVHQEECCVDTLPRGHPQPARKGANNPSLAVGSGNAAGEEVGGSGGRGLCVRHYFQRFAEAPDWESLGSPDAVYFGVGLHLLHMTRRGHPLEAEKVQGWLNYERDLERAVQTYRAEGGDGFRRSRPVMTRLGVPVVEGDLIVRDQEWATPQQDGRHYPMLVPVEVWELLGVLVSPFA
eukprot:g13984.t1